MANEDEFEVVGLGNDQDVQEAISRGDVDPPEDDQSDEGPEEHIPDELSVDTAFVIFVQDGEAFAAASVGTLELTHGDQVVRVDPIRQADLRTMWLAATEVAADIDRVRTAEKLIEAQQAHIMQMQAALQQAQPGGGRLHIPR